MKSWACTTSNVRAEASAYAPSAQRWKALLRCCGSSSHRPTRAGQDNRRPDSEAPCSPLKTDDVPTLETVMPVPGSKPWGTDLPMMWTV